MAIVRGKKQLTAKVKSSVVKNGKASKNSITNAIHEGAKPFFHLQRTSEVFGNYTGDSTDFLSKYDRNQLTNKARYFYENVGAVKGAIDEIATYSVGGDAWLPHYLGRNPKEFGTIAEQWINDWFNINDVAGTPFIYNLWLASIALDRDGDVLLHLTYGADNEYPMIEFIPCNHIGSKTNTVEGGPFDGYDVIDGVIVNENFRPIGYNIIHDTLNPDDGSTQVTTEDSLLTYEPRYFGQLRGYSALGTALAEIADYRDIKDAEKEGIRQLSSIAFQEHNEQGGLLPGDIQSGNYSTASVGLFHKYYNNGTIRYFGSTNPNNGIKQVENNRPGTNTSLFLKDHILRSAFNSIGWPLELSWDMQGLNSANTRAILAKAERKLKQRQATLKRLWTRVVWYGLAKAMKLGLLPQDVDGRKFEPVEPKVPSIDIGRDVKNDLELLKVCGTTLTDIHGKNADRFPEKMQRRVSEVRSIMDECEKQKVPIEYVFNPSNNFQQVKQLTTEGNNEPNQAD